MFLGGVGVWFGLASTLFGRPVAPPPELDERELAERKQAFEAMLQRNGWDLDGDHVRVPSTWAMPKTAQPSTTPVKPHRTTIFLNFYGSEMMQPGTNAALDQSPCLAQAMPWPGFQGSEAQALALLDVFERNMAPYGVRIAYQERPPAHLPYAMVMMGGTPDLLGLGSGVLGVSCSSDCADRWWRDTTFAFTGGRNLDRTEILGTTALHEAAHAFGFAHIDDPTRIMHPFADNARATWATECTVFSEATSGISCRDTHAQFCADGQNSHAELLAMFGPNSVDSEPPIVDILYPPDGLELEVGGSVTLQAHVEDNFDGFGWKLVVPEAGAELVAYGFEREWPLTNMPQGVYTLRVEAIDHERNEASDEVRIYVGVPAGTPSPVDDDEDADTGGCSVQPNGRGAPLTLGALALCLGAGRLRRRPGAPHQTRA